jgi:hypothetical protein
MKSLQEYINEGLFNRLLKVGLPADHVAAMIRGMLYEYVNNFTTQSDSLKQDIRDNMRKFKYDEKTKCIVYNGDEHLNEFFHFKPKNVLGFQIDPYLSSKEAEQIKEKFLKTRFGSALAKYSKKVIAAEKAEREEKIKKQQSDPEYCADILAGIVVEYQKNVRDDDETSTHKNYMDKVNDVRKYKGYDLDNSKFKKAFVNALSKIAHERECHFNSAWTNVDTVAKCFRDWWNKLDDRIRKG